MDCKCNEKEPRNTRKNANAKNVKCKLRTATYSLLAKGKSVQVVLYTSFG